MKKIIKWGAIGLVVFFVFVTAVGFMSGDSEVVFDESKALSKIQTYSFTELIKGESAERYLTQYFKELAEKIPEIEEGKWDINEAVGIENGFYVVYKYKSYSGYSNPKWLVTEDKIVAVDKESRSLTPGLAPEGYNAKDELIYEGFNSNLSEEFDSDPENVSEEFAEISYNNAYQVTADEYKITVDEVKEAIERNRKATAIK